MPLPALAGGLLGLAGSFFGGNREKRGLKDARDLTTSKPFTFDTGLFQTGMSGDNATGTLSPELAALQQQMMQGAGNLGADFGNAGGFEGLNPEVAAQLQQANSFTGEGLNPFFLPQQQIMDAGLTNLQQFQDDTGQRVLADSFFNASGGALGDLLSFNPQAAADDRLGLMRERAAPQEELRQQALDKRLFARGMLGSTGGSLNQKALQDSFSEADLGRQQASFDEARTQQRSLLENAGFGAQAGSNLLTSNLGDRNSALASALGIDETGFNRITGLDSLQSGRASERFSRAMDSFNLGQEQLNQNQNRSFQMLGGATGLDKMLFDMMSGGISLGNERAAANANAGDFQARAGKQSGSLISGVLGGIGGLLSSDERLKENLRELRHVPEYDLTEFSWDWNEEAKRIGVADQPTRGFIAQDVQAKYPNAVIEDPETGYLMIDYGVL